MADNLHEVSACVASCTLMMMGKAVEINRKRRRKRRKCLVKPWIKLRPISAGRGSHDSYAKRDKYGKILRQTCHSNFLNTENILLPSSG